MDKKLKDLFLYNNFLAPAIISIDGPCGSGKTTIASEIENEFGYNILHMDDFYLPFYERDKNWMNIVAGHMDFERLISNVIVPYKNKCKTKYISYDCHSDKFISMWVPFENNYFESLKIRESCDIYIKSI